MKKYFLTAMVAICSLALISWGVTGHRAVGKIAENHLSPKAKAAVQDLLGNESLADVSTWADELRSKPEFKYTTPWHYMNLPLGLNYQQFEQKVNGLGTENVYAALKKCEQELLSPVASREDKIKDLKFIVHFVGDLHQPMHISRAEDQGGNTIQLSYNGKGTNLHSVWDSKLLDTQGLTYEQVAEKYDHVSAAQIKQWQREPLMKWIWESYGISSKLYAEIDVMNGRSINDSYYQAHLPIVQQRIEQAGVRLAGVLNEIFKGGPVNSAIIPPPPMADNQYPLVEEDVIMGTVCDKVSGGRYIDGSGITFINLGGAYPNQKLTIMIKAEDRVKFKVAPETAFLDKLICVTGKQIMYKGKPEIMVTDPEQIKVQ